MFLNSIFGIWLFTGMIYHGQPMPPLNPALQIYFQFESSGSNRLYYYRKGEPGFCERKATYQIQDNKLLQTVVWANPDNAIYCGQDTDMQLGNKSSTPLRLVDNQMQLTFQLAEEDLVYIWDRRDKIETKHCPGDLLLCR